MRFRSLTMLTAMTVLSLAVAAPVHAAPICGKRADFVEKLNDKFGETLDSAGLENRGSVFEIYKSSGGSWTILVTQADGSTCVLATGEAWTISDQSEDREKSL